ncbi:hypothetical protein CSAL01_03113 [Colletotrichum salicis]|uniref:beta-glucosidase n=1 Tax=Colletotrichum salicis TaxID=1209931 RepID=A0A135UTZ2_9PEZI|nr:hypothetical protein CSAL01_03113 [Colletotrichum salicis]
MTLEEKVLLLTGEDLWRTKFIPRLGISRIKTSDGPTGVRGGIFVDGVTAASLPSGRVAVVLFLLTESRLTHNTEGQIPDWKEEPERAVDLPEHRKILRHAGAEGIVLLKNEKSTLPLADLGGDGRRQLEPRASLPDHAFRILSKGTLRDVSDGSGRDGTWNPYASISPSHGFHCHEISRNWQLWICPVSMEKHEARRQPVHGGAPTELEPGLLRWAPSWS